MRTWKVKIQIRDYHNEGKKCFPGLKKGGGLIKKKKCEGYGCSIVQW